MSIVLLSPVGGRATHSIIKYLKEKGYQIVGIDHDDEAVGQYFVDKFIQVPKIGSASYEECLYEIIEQNRIDFFITSLDPEIIYWNQVYHGHGFNDLMEKVYTFNIMPNIMNFVDKLFFCEVVKRKNFLSPFTIPLDHNILINGDLRFPLILKPRISYGSRDIFMVKSKEELKLYLYLIELKYNGNSDKFIVQEYIDGKEYSIDFFSVNGELMNLVIRERIKKESVSLIGQVVYNSEIESLIKSYSFKQSLSGLHNVQIIVQNSRIYMIEHNIRYSGTVALSIASGVDLLNNLIEYKTGRSITRYGIPKAIKMVRYYEEIYI